MKKIVSFGFFILTGSIQVLMASIYENDPLWATPLKVIPLEKEAIKSTAHFRLNDVLEYLAFRHSASFFWMNNHVLGGVRMLYFMMSHEI